MKWMPSTVVYRLVYSSGGIPRSILTPRRYLSARVLLQCTFVTNANCLCANSIRPASTLIRCSAMTGHRPRRWYIVAPACMLARVTDFQKIKYSFWLDFIYYRATWQYVRLSVRPSVTRRYSVETAKQIIRVFFTVGSQIVLVFPYQTVW